MTRIISRGAFVGLAVAPLVALAACGSSGSGAGSSATTSATTSASSGNGQLAATVDVANNNLGPILVDQQGRTLYLFAKDSSTTSACTDACAVAWPPLRSDAQPTVAGGGTEPSLIGTTPRSDGSPQVTYNGHPLWLAALAAPKTTLTLHLMPIYANSVLLDRLKAGFAKAGKPLRMGKGCINFQTAHDLALDAIADIVSGMPVKKWVEIACSAKPRPKAIGTPVQAVVPRAQGVL